MKVSVNLHLDVDVAFEFAKEKNKSQMINSYLRNYYNLKSKEEVKK